MTGAGAEIATSAAASMAEILACSGAEAGVGAGAGAGAAIAGKVAIASAAMQRSRKGAPDSGRAAERPWIGSFVVTRGSLK